MGRAATLSALGTCMGLGMRGRWFDPAPTYPWICRYFWTIQRPAFGAGTVEAFRLVDNPGQAVDSLIFGIARDLYKFLYLLQDVPRMHASAIPKQRDHAG